MYNEALKASGFKETVLFTEKENQPQKRNSTKSRHRNVLWFNPPYTKNVETNVGKRFPKNHKLHKIFNRKNVKVSYGCVDNIAQIIKQHNKKVLTPQTALPPEMACNCRVKPDCPLNGECLTKGIVYQAEVKADDQTKPYIEMTEHPFKTRYNVHKQSFRNQKYQHSTALSKHIWELKNRGKSYEINWSIIKHAKHA